MQSCIDVPVGLQQFQIQPTSSLWPVSIFLSSCIVYIWHGPLLYQYRPKGGQMVGRWAAEGKLLGSGAHMGFNQESRQS